MAVQAFKFSNKYHQQISGTVNNGSTGFDLHLLKSTSNIAKTLSTLGSITNEVASANGYTKSGKVITKTWSAGASAGQAKLNFTAVSLSASGNITSVMIYAVIARTGASAKDAANKIVGFASLTSAVFQISSGNKFILNPDATNGLFTLAG